MGARSKEWDDSPYPGLMYCQTSTQEFPQTDPINDNTKKAKSRIIHVRDTIMAATVEAAFMKIGVFLTTIRHATHSSMENFNQISEVLSMDNIYVSNVT